MIFLKKATQKYSGATAFKGKLGNIVTKTSFCSVEGLWEIHYERIPIVGKVWHTHPVKRLPGWSAEHSTKHDLTFSAAHLVRIDRQETKVGEKESGCLELVARWGRDTFTAGVREGEGTFSCEAHTPHRLLQLRLLLNQPSHPLVLCQSLLVRYQRLHARDRPETEKPMF